MTITNESKFLAISGTYDCNYGNKSFTKTLILPVEWFKEKDLESFAKSIQIELSFGEIEGKHSDCYETGVGSIVDLDTAIEMAMETTKNGYDYDDWSDTDCVEEIDEIFSNNHWTFFEKFRTEFKKVLEEKTCNKVKFEVSLDKDKFEEFENFLNSINAKFKQI